MKTHLPIIVNFWEKILFGNPVYYGNSMIVHQQLHQRAPFEKAHFDCWLKIFTMTVDRLFIGEMANKAKDKAATIAQSMFAFLVENAAPKIHALTQ